jgi:hypothetical protein
MNLNQIGCEGVDWIDAAQDRGRWLAIVNAVMNIQIELSIGDLFFM